MVAMPTVPPSPDDEIATRPVGHRPAVPLGALLPDEVQDHFGTLARGQLEDPLHVLAVDKDRLVRSPTTGEGKGVLVGVEYDDAGGAHRPQTLDADVAEAAGPHHDARTARIQQRHRRFDPGGEPDHRAGGGPDQVRQAAVGVDAGERARLAVHVVTGPTGPAEAGCHQRVKDHGVAGLHVLHRRTDRMDPAGVLVAQGVRQRDVALLRPLTLDDVQVGTAQSRTSDPDDHAVRAPWPRVPFRERVGR